MARDASLRAIDEWSPWLVVHSIARQRLDEACRERVGASPTPAVLLTP